MTAPGTRGLFLVAMVGHEVRCGEGFDGGTPLGGVWHVSARSVHAGLPEEKRVGAVVEKRSIALSRANAESLLQCLLRYPFADEAKNNADLTLKGDLAEAWQGSADFRTWTFKLRQGVKWHNVPPLNGRELVAEDIKYCYEAYAKEGVQSFTFQEIDGMETPDKYTIRIQLKTPNTMFPQNVAEAVAVIFPREVLEEDGDLKTRMIGTGPFILKENQRKVKVVLTRNPDYFDKGYPYIDEYRILSTPDAATRLAAFRTGQSDVYAAIPGQKSASNMLDQWNFGTMPLSLPVKARVVGG